jgi:hypothetical protein
MNAKTHLLAFIENLQGRAATMIVGSGPMNGIARESFKQLQRLIRHLPLSVASDIGVWRR